MKRSYEEASMPFADTFLRAQHLKQTKLVDINHINNNIYDFEIDEVNNVMDEAEDIPEWVYDKLNNIMRNDIPHIEELE